MDWNKLQHTLFSLDPSDPAEDLRKLTESASGNVSSVAPTVDYVDQAVQISEGSLPVDGDYSIADFAALAGVTLTEAQKTGSTGQAKGKDSMPKAEPGRTKHPLKDKLVGEDFKDDFKTGRANYNSLELFKSQDDDKSKSSTSKTTKTSKSKAEPAVKSSDWRGFLKQHTAGLQAIAADPAKRKRFDTWMAKWNEEIEEENKGLYHNVNKRKKAGTSRSKDHPKAPTDKAWKDAAKTAKTESVESIKEMLYRKLNNKK